MSSIIYFTNEEQAVIATDTLAVDFDGDPTMFVSKAFMVPHLRMIIAGTGMGGFSDAWAMRVNTSMAVEDIIGLDRHAPEALRALWAEFEARPGFPINQTVTIYAFGFSAEDGKMRVFVYRSTNQFRSEAQVAGLGVKPACTLPGSASVEWPAHFRTMMDEQRTLQVAVPVAERIHIGGEINVMVLDPEGCRSFTQSRFDDYDGTLHFILHRHSKPSP